MAESRLSKSARNVLTAAQVRNLKRTGLHADGGGLYLKVATGKSWVFRYQFGGQRHLMGLGPLVDVTLKEARDKAAEMRALLRDGIDPLLARAERRRGAIEATQRYTFKQAATRYMDTHSRAWTVKHAAQWQSTLERYAYPAIGNHRAVDVSTDAVVRILAPIWNTKRETARRVRNRIELVLGWAATAEKRDTPNPARWKNNLDTLLTKDSKAAQRKKPMAALKTSELPAFMADLGKRDAMAARALEFVVLTAARTNEVLEVRWSEIDFDDAVWRIPADRMKAGEPHEIPLSKAAFELLKAQPIVGEYVFPGHRTGKPMSNMAMLTLMQKRMGYRATVHGFRSVFATWAAEATDAPSEVIEHALAHSVGDETTRAYRRTKLLPQRRKLMDRWAAYCTKAPTAKVVPLR